MTCENEVKLSNFLLKKYSDIINEREQRTIGEIKGLVDGTDLSIGNFVEEFKENNYSFKDNYKETLKKLFDFAKKEINFVEVDLGVNYWMSAKEVLELKIVDDEDYAVFLCSCMKALGDDKAEVIIAELDNLRTHAFVSSVIDDKFLILDPAQKHEFEEFFGEKTEILRKYSFKKERLKRFLYRFNSDKYEQFLEE